LVESSKELLALQNIELDLTKKRVTLENESNTLTRKLDEINYQKRVLAKVQEQIENLERKRKGFELELKRTQEMQTAIESNKVQQVNIKEYKDL
jgi:predicted  nucleic acid-binding Zn-ribbon protein